MEKTPPPNHFKGTKEKPYHLSVGAVILNDENKVCCHYFEKMTLRKVFEDYKDFYILMRETVEMGETLEQALHRGLFEEFGVTGDIVTFLGSIKSEYILGGATVEKTTLYFLVNMKTFQPELRSLEDVEKESEIQWQDIDFLISKMKNQGLRPRVQPGLSDWSSLDESSMLERVRARARGI